MSIDLSLERLQRLLPHLPLQYTRPTVHIAGTNGKGSVSALVSSILTHTHPPLSIGRFNSPHLIHITDSITINNIPVDNHSYLIAKTCITNAYAAQNTRLTSFEILTLTAFHLFEQANVDIAIVEVGMGGTLDSTNIIPSHHILASALTAVDLDHQRFLGPTLSAIATQKAGIARPGKPFIFGPQLERNRKDVGAAVQRTLSDIGADIFEPAVVSTRGVAPRFSLSAVDFQPPLGVPVQVSIPAISPEPIPALLPLHGTHQLDNLSTSGGIVQALLSHPACTELCTQRGLDLKMLLTREAVQRGIENVRWSGRLSWHIYPPSKIPVLVDGAHNPASSQTLNDYIRHLISTDRTSNMMITYILALSDSPPKSPKDTLAPLFVLPQHAQAAGRCISTSIALVPFTPPTDMPWVKFVSPAQLSVVARDIFSSAETPPKIWTPPEHAPLQLDEGSSNTYLADALSWAHSLRQQYAGDGDVDHLVVVAGSLYLVADFYRLPPFQSAK